VRERRDNDRDGVSQSRSYSVLIGMHSKCSQVEAVPLCENGTDTD